ncbi:hypothetical protein BU23DRAFT_530618 [Bimuria novae-zelandiae CBS 107.79]|uniref:Uncharacterized protein n=1 Tax=Bimuria novae-zelandiae CBS 107.79 TaxID=1447943 RepID=A0A6A5VDN6_9PLEO|nr:hypothetical protein BU23DRAFT_530618 [Bimuria novae-zelandiae CBS 107.79]
MGLYQLRRPSSIQITPTRVRRQNGATAEVPESPNRSGVPNSHDSPDISGAPESPDSPKSSGLPSPAASGVSSSLQPPAPPQAAQTSKISSQVISSTVAQVSAAPSTPSLPISTAQEQTTTSSPSATSTAAQGTASSDGPTPSAPAALPVTSTPARDSRPATIGTTFVPAQSELDGERSGIGREHDHQRTIISKGGEVAAITLSVIGLVALMVGIFIFFRRRKRRNDESSMRHAQDAFNPGNCGSLHAPETTHIGDGLGGPPPSLAHMTKSSTYSGSLFGGSHYQRPETVSTNSNASRMAATPSMIRGQPTPNPFADPPLNKAYDQLRGRPRSTTLTDRGSWIKNPFRDPASERFDPFGELQEKARAERRKYVEEARREAEEMRRREEEQDYLEKERMGLTIPNFDERKGSGVPVSGLGVLDRSWSSRYR